MLVNALQSGTDNPVASTLRELEYIPNAHYYAAMHLTEGRKVSMVGVPHGFRRSRSSVSMEARERRLVIRSSRRETKLLRDTEIIVPLAGMCGRHAVRDTSLRDQR